MSSNCYWIVEFYDDEGKIIQEKSFKTIQEMCAHFGYKQSAMRNYIKGRVGYQWNKNKDMAKVQFKKIMTEPNKKYVKHHLCPTCKQNIFGKAPPPSA